MKQFLLLRENQESGPYSVEDLRDLGLVSYDLIWVEGKSLNWVYPSEVEELAELPVGNSLRKGILKSKFEEPTAPQEPLFENRVYTTQPSSYAYADLQTFPEDKESYLKHLQDRKFSFQSDLSKSSGLWIVGLFLVLASSAFVVKSIVESFDENPYKEAKAHAYAMPVTDEFVPVTQDDPSYKNALVTEVVAVDTTPVMPAKKKLVAGDLEKQVTLQSNASKTGMTGTVQNLQLTLKNSSHHKLDRVTVEVKFYKAGGEVVKTEYFDLSEIPAGGRKVLEVSDNKPGVKVSYKVVTVESAQQKASLRNA